LKKTLPCSVSRLAGVLAASALAAAGSAHAQLIDSDAPLPTQAAAGRDVGTAGASLRFGQVGTGNKSGEHDRAWLIPELGYYAASGWFASTTQGLGMNLSTTPGLQFGPRLTVDLGRPERLSDALRGMGRIDPRLEAGGFLNWQPMRDVWLTSSLRAGAGNDHNGVHIDLGANYSYELAPGLKLRLGGSTTLANQAYVQSYYGVNATQAAATGYAVYSPKAGFTDISASATLSYALTPRTSLSAGVISKHLLGDAQDSPVTRKVTATTGQLGLNYAF
jgi:outer membrane protein